MDACLSCACGDAYRDAEMEHTASPTFLVLTVSMCIVDVKEMHHEYA